MRPRGPAPVAVLELRSRAADSPADARHGGPVHGAGLRHDADEGVLGLGGGVEVGPGHEPTCRGAYLLRQVGVEPLEEVDRDAEAGRDQPPGVAEAAAVRVAERDGPGQWACAQLGGGDVVRGEYVEVRRPNLSPVAAE
jgi:hypothetical protein